MELGDVLSRLDSVRSMPSGNAARCPAHDDNVASLMVREGDHGGVVLKCHAGCAVEDVVKAMGLKMSDLMGLPMLVETYQYTTEDGEPLYQVERWANPKTFRGFLPPPAERVMYALPWVKYARERGLPLYVVEGERDVHTLLALGIPATTNPTGAGPGKWLPHYADQLAGCNVVVVADNDDVGRAHAREIGESLTGKVISLTLTVPRFGKDVTDLVAAGYTLEALEPLPEQEGTGIFRADKVKRRKVEWAWPKYFAKGKLSIVEGDPGDGKSILTLDLASRWSTGAAMPDGANGLKPWQVLLVSAEDDPEDTLRPRLDAAGARLEHVHLVTHGATPDVPFEFNSGLRVLEKAVLRYGVQIVIFDPLMAFIGGDTDTHSDHSVRRALQPLKRFAEATGAAVIVVRHLNKGGSSTKAIYRGGGSIGFVGAARATFVVAQQDDGMRVLACVKTNLAKKPPALRYTIESNEDDIPYIKWHGVVSLTAQELLDGPEKEAGSSEADDRQSAVEDAMEYLEFLLGNGPLSWDEIKNQGKIDGYAEHTLRRARGRAKVLKEYGTTGNRSVTWRLDGDAQSESISPDAQMPSHLTSNANRTNGGANGKVGTETTTEGDGQMGSGPVELTDEDREAALDAAPLVCDICATTEGVGRWAKPWWAIRCPDHIPLVMGR